MHTQINTNNPCSHRQREGREDGLSWINLEKVGEVAEGKVKEGSEKEDRVAEIKEGEG